MVLGMSNIATTVVTRTDRTSGRSITLPFSEMIGTAIALLTDGPDAESELMMVRGDGEFAGKTVLAVANGSWLEEMGEFVFLPSTDQQAWDRVKASPRTWTIVALTEALCSSTSGTEASKAYFALKAFGIDGTVHIIQAEGIEFRLSQGGPPLTEKATYRDVYNDRMLYHSERGHLNY